MWIEKTKYPYFSLNKGKKIKKINTKISISNNKHANTIIKTNVNAKIKQEHSIASALNTKKTDVASKKRNVVPATAAAGGSLTLSHKLKNAKTSKIEEEQHDNYKSYDSSELSEEEYTYKN